MSRFSPIYLTFLVALLTSIVTPATTETAKSLYDRKSFMQKLNQFMTYVNQGFQSVATSMKVLKNFHTNKDQIDSRLIANINSSIQKLKSLEPVCLKGWTRYGASCFLVIPGTQFPTAQIAKKMCLEKGAHLSKCTSREQQNFFLRLVKPQTHWIIIGGKKKDGKWQWPDGSLMNAGFTNWAAGNPAKNQDCMYINPGNKLWYGNGCTGGYSPQNRLTCICEMPTSF